MFVLPSECLYLINLIRREYKSLVESEEINEASPVLKGKLPKGRRSKAAASPSIVLSPAPLKPLTRQHVGALQKGHNGYIYIPCRRPNSRKFPQLVATECFVHACSEHNHVSVL